MEKQHHTTKPHQKVRLKMHGQDALYKKAYAGSQGWVRKHDHDNLGYPMVFIEWDKDHWTYNGEEDMWAMEAHFEPVEDEMGEEEGKSDQELFQEFVEWKRNKQSGDQSPEDDQVSDTIKAHQEHRKIAEVVGQQLAESDSFIAIWIDRDEQNGAPVLAARIATNYLSPEGGLLAEGQAFSVAGQAYEELSLAAMRKAIDEKPPKIV